jgi:hypothetical protein
MAVKSSNSYVIATTTFHAPGDLTVAEGNIRTADDPVVKAHQQMFRPVEDLAD